MVANKDKLAVSSQQAKHYGKNLEEQVNQFSYEISI